MNRSVPALLILALAGGSAGGYFQWKSHVHDREWAALRPLTPATIGATSPGLDVRLAELGRRLAGSRPDLPALAEFTRVCHANGQLDAALTGYRSLMVLEPREPRWSYGLASILAGFGQLEEAIPLLRRTAELAPDYLPAQLTLAEALLKSNATSEAESVYRAALQRDAENVFAMLGLARCDLQANRLTAARAQLQRVVSAHPNSASAQSLLGSVFERLGNTQGAELARWRMQRGIRDSEPVNPWIDDLVHECHDPYTLLIAASAALADGRPADALPVLKKGLALAPENAGLHRQLGRTLGSLHDFEGARGAMERAVALDPANDTIHLDLLTLLSETPDTAAWDAAVLRGAAACPASAALRFEAGLIAARTGQLDEATQHFEYAWTSHPDQTAAALELARIHFRRHQPPAAVSVLEDVLARHPQNSAAALMLLQHGIEVGDSRAARWLQRAVEANPAAPALPELRQNYQRRFGHSP